jgi:hypothetical protein
VPFERLLPRSFTASSIRDFAPTVPGVYGISNARQWLYIGETENIQGALTQHLLDIESPITGHGAKGFVYEICSAERKHERCARLTLEYSPLCM